MSIWKNIANSQRGFTVVEVLGGVVIISLVGLAGARMFKDQRETQAKLDHEQTLQQFHLNLTKFLQDEKNCNATFSDWLNRNPFQVVASGTSELWNCANCGTTLGFNYDLSSATRGTRFLQLPTWIENVNGGSAYQRGLWRITSMNWKPGYTQPTGTGTYMLSVNYEMDPSVAGSRAVKKMSVNKDIALNFRFTQNTDPNLRLFKECLSPKESAVNNLQSDICQTMTQVTSAGNVMQWSDATQSCDVIKSSVVKNCPDQNMVVAGIKSDGTVHCVPLNKGINPAADMGDTTACAPGSNISLVYDSVSKKMKTVCN